MCLLPPSSSAATLLGRVTDYSAPSQLSTDVIDQRLFDMLGSSRVKHNSFFLDLKWNGGLRASKWHGSMLCWAQEKVDVKSKYRERASAGIEPIRGERRIRRVSNIWHLFPFKTLFSLLDARLGRHTLECSEPKPSHIELIADALAEWLCRSTFFFFSGENGRRSC